jgi:hypothetical protein
MIGEVGDLPVLAVWSEAGSQPAQLGKGTGGGGELDYADRVASDCTCSVDGASHCVCCSEPGEADAAVSLIVWRPSCERRCKQLGGSVGASESGPATGGFHLDIGRRAVRGRRLRLAVEVDRFHRAADRVDAAFSVAGQGQGVGLLA